MTASAATLPEKFDVVGIRRYRLERVRQEIDKRDLAAVLLFDPVNIRYASGSRNMQVWTMHNVCRSLFVPAAGPAVLFELATGMHLSRDLETIDEIRPALAWDYMIVGDNNQDLARRWAAEIADLVRQHGGGNKRLGLDRADWLPAQALTAEGIEVEDGKAVLEHARAIKAQDEIAAFKASLATCEASLATCEAAVADLRAALKPGLRESEALALLIHGSVARGGEYPETRLLTSGPRTNPWFQETGDRVMQAGDLLSFDTDLIGPMGFYNDISRSWLVGDGRPSDEQRRLYDLARRQVEHNTTLLRPGVNFLEYADQAFALPEACLPNRYADVAHGCGLGVEYPLIWYREDADFGAYDGRFEENMIVCVESYVGEAGGAEGVKLEQPVWITADGPVVLADDPLEDDYA